MAPKTKAIKKRSRPSKKGPAKKRAQSSHWNVYLLECSDRSYYCGIASDLDRRIKQHNGSPQGAKYTRTRRPVKLVWHTQVPNRSVASKEEIRIKRLNRAQKKALIKSGTPSAVQ